MSQRRWQSACLQGTKQTRLNSREPQTDGIYRNRLRAEEELVPPPEGGAVICSESGQRELHRGARCVHE